MSTPKARKTNTEARGLLAEELSHTKGQTEQKVTSANPDWAKLVAERNGSSPFRGKEFLSLIAGGRFGAPALGGAWPTNGEPKEWREAAGVSTLSIATLFGLNTELVDSWEAIGAGEPFPGNWLGGDYDDLAVRRLYGSFKSYKQNGPYAPGPGPEPVPERPPVEVLMADGLTSKALWEATGLPYQVEPSQLAGEGAFLRVCVRGELPGIPVLRDVPSGDELRRIREESGYSLERWGALLGAAPSRIRAWERGEALPGQDVDNGGLPAALRLYGTVQAVLDIREANAA